MRGRHPRAQDRETPTAASDRGSVTPVALAFVAVLVVVALALGVVVDLLAARQKAADVADLAALAAVSTVLPDEARACGDAAWVVQQHGAMLRACAVVDGDARVVVGAPMSGPLAVLVARMTGRPPEPSVEARAGRR